MIEVYLAHCYNRRLQIPVLLFCIGEPPHIHVLRDANEAKIWLQPVVLQHNHGYNQTELNRILRLTRQNQDKLLEVWNAYFSQ
jgi:hypothetical protein